jgi:hypothetical protein
MAAFGKSIVKRNLANFNNNPWALASSCFRHVTMLNLVRSAYGRPERQRQPQQRQRGRGSEVGSRNLLISLVYLTRS